MFTEGQLYSAVTQHADGSVEVHLSDNHPGLHDGAYRARRSQIAGAAMAWRPGQPVPRIAYTDAEHEVWQLVNAELTVKHAKYACADYLAGVEALGLPTDHVPQLDEVSAALHPLTGWSYHAAPGLVPLREFYTDLGRRTFNSTQYLRYAGQPLYTPEPDIIHEVVGHANQLASPRFARLTAAAGASAARLESEESLKFVADVFWFTLEFGVVVESGEPKAYGAGILSSYGEMDEYGHMEHRPLDLVAMGTLPYDITSYQPVLYAARSLDEVDDVVGTFFDTVDDDLVARLRAQAST